MFNTLSKNLTNILEKLTKKGIVTEADVNNTLREVRISLLEADVALEVVKDLIEKIRVKATGQSVIKSVTPGQQVIKIVNDELVELLSGKDQSDHSLKIDSPPASILMVGLQGSGKTTTSAKLANFGNWQILARAAPRVPPGTRERTFPEFCRFLAGSFSAVSKQNFARK